jgi:hypothetical protein
LRLCRAVKGFRRGASARIAAKALSVRRVPATKQPEIANVMPVPEPSTGLTLDARFAAATTELVARVTAKTAIVGVYLTAAGALLAAISGASWLPLAVPYVGAAATWLIFIEDGYIYSLVDFLARCEDAATEWPALRYSTRGWMATNIKRQWWWWYPIFGQSSSG